MSGDTTTYTFLRIKNGKRYGDPIRITDAKSLADATFNAAEFAEPGEELVRADRLDKLPLY